MVLYIFILVALICAFVLAFDTIHDYFFLKGKPTPDQSEQGALQEQELTPMLGLARQLEADIYASEIPAVSMLDMYAEKKDNDPKPDLDRPKSKKKKKSKKKDKKKSKKKDKKKK